MALELDELDATNLPPGARLEKDVPERQPLEVRTSLVLLLEAWFLGWKHKERVRAVAPGACKVNHFLKARFAGKI